MLFRVDLVNGIGQVGQHALPGMFSEGRFCNGENLIVEHHASTGEAEIGENHLGLSLLRLPGDLDRGDQQALVLESWLEHAGQLLTCLLAGWLRGVFPGNQQGVGKAFLPEFFLQHAERDVSIPRKGLAGSQVESSQSASGNDMDHLQPRDTADRVITVSQRAVRADLL